MGYDDVDEEEMYKFNCCMEELDVTEFPAAGFFCTWCNLRENEARTYSKIDRFLVNES